MTAKVPNIPDPSKKAKRRAPVDLMTRRRSAPSRRSDTATGNRYLKTTPYVCASDGMRPTLLAARPIKILTRAPLSALPHFVLSDLKNEYKSLINHCITSSSSPHILH
jgi:hypothetical protein